MEEGRLPALIENQLCEQLAPLMTVSNLPAPRLAQQQSLPGTVNNVGQPTSSVPPQPVGEPEKRRLIQHQLLVLLHASKCLKQENQSNGKIVQCSVPHCRTMKDVLNHITNCSAGKMCPYPRCTTSRQILLHWRSCTRVDCLVCMPLKKVPEKQQQAVNNQAPQCLPQNINSIQAQQTAQTPQSQVQLQSVLQNNSGMLTNESGQNILADQTKVRAGNVPPIIIGTLPQNSAIVKDWHQLVTQDLRQHLMQNIVEAIFPTTDTSAYQDARFVNLVTYARKVEGDMYCAANSREEYYQLIAEKIYKIQKELEEKRQKRKEMQLLQIGANMASMPGSNSGKASPSLQSSSECVICFEKEVNCVLYRCGHMHSCYTCALKLCNSSSRAQCPICRNPIQDVIKIYK